MSRRLVAPALLCAGLLLAGAAAAVEQPSTLPGKQGGDPAPDTRTALDQIARGRYDDAILSAKRSLGRDEKYTPAMMAMAKAYYYLRKYELATSIIEIALKINPSIPEAYVLRGYLALNQDNRIGATAEFKKATELKADYGNAWNNLAAMYLYAKNYDAAVEAAEKATELLPRFDKAFLNLGSAYRGKARYADAERAYRKALDQNAQYAAVYFNLGILYLDATQIGTLDTTARLNQALSHFGRYKDFASRLPPVASDPVDAYVEEAKKALVLESKRLEREKKKRERQQPKAAPAADSGEAAPAPAPTAGGTQPGMEGGN